MKEVWTLCNKHLKIECLTYSKHLLSINTKSNEISMCVEIIVAYF